MKHLLGIIGSAAMLTLSAQSALAQKPPEDATDHPLLSRFEGSTMAAYQTVDYDAVKIPAGPTGEGGKPTDLLDLEGRITWISYNSPESKSTLEVGRNYEAALAEGGFEILFSCSGSDCGKPRDFNRYAFRSDDVFRHNYHDWMRGGEQMRVLLAKGSDDEGAPHVLVYIDQHRRHHAKGVVRIAHLIVENQDMATGQVKASVRSASELQKALVDDGKAVVDGIFFELDSAEIRSESAEALEQMAVLMTNRPDIQVSVVGHTDNQGSLQYNIDLSERRAQAVRRALIDDYGVEGDRMGALGVGFSSPVASNSTEEGRAQNRRVELVLH